MALPPSDPLERARIRAIYVVLALIVVLVVASLTPLTPRLDLGVFATLVGAELALVGVGAVIKLVGK